MIHLPLEFIELHEISPENPIEIARIIGRRSRGNQIKKQLVQKMHKLK